MMVTMQQSMMEFMSFMKMTMQTLVQNQYMVLQLLADYRFADLRITMWNANGVSRHNLEVTQLPSRW